VIQRRALDGGRGSFHALAVVRADDRFHGFLGRFACDRFGDRAITRPPAAALLECHEPSNGGLLLLCQDAVARDREPVLAPPPNAQRRADDRSACKQQPAATGPGVALQQRGPTGRDNKSNRAASTPHTLRRRRKQARGLRWPQCYFDEPVPGEGLLAQGRLAVVATMVDGLLHVFGPSAALGGNVWPESELRDETLQLLGLTDSAVLLEQTSAGDSTEILTRLRSWLADRDPSEQAPRTQLAPLLDS